MPDLINRFALELDICVGHHLWMINIVNVVISSETFQRRTLMVKHWALYNKALFEILKDSARLRAPQNRAGENTTSGAIS